MYSLHLAEGLSGIPHAVVLPGERGASRSLQEQKRYERAIGARPPIRLKRMVKIYIGTQGWSYKDWIGPFYPPNARSTYFLSFYAQEFDAVELDTTFYGTPDASRVERWFRSTPDDFQFTAKMPRTITHELRLVRAEAETSEFIEVMAGLGTKLGAVVIQLPPDFTAEERPALEAYLAALPAGPRYAAEFRHRSWLDESTYDLLAGHGVAWTMIDLPYMPITPVVTADFSYARLLGDHRKIKRINETQLDRTGELHRWGDRLADVAHRTERVYGFVNNHYSGHSPADVRRLRTHLGIEGTVRETPSVRQGSLL
jgi:uncharacterized protein YecE (DUF72 family)